MKDNNVAKHAQRSGAGPHKDRKRDSKRVRGGKHNRKVRLTDGPESLCEAELNGVSLGYHDNQQMAERAIQDAIEAIKQASIPTPQRGRRNGQSHA
ncbi:MAG: hypothetical protein GY764_11365 [Halieaceae bacterium]|nr:hypothetical protein [Halieaceae bacterium]